VTRGPWLNVATELASESWKFYDRITLNGKTYRPPVSNGSYWLPLESDTLLKIDYSQRATENPESRPVNLHPMVPKPERFSQPLLGSGIALNIEWIDGTIGQFAVHNDDNSSKPVIAIRLPDSAGRVPGQKFDRLAYFAMAQAKEEVVEFTAENLMIAHAVLLGTGAETVVAAGWIVYNRTWPSFWGS
jgi:hypothetical protein